MSSLITFPKDAAVKAGLVVKETADAVMFVLPRTIFAIEATLNEQGDIAYESHIREEVLSVLIDWLTTNHIEYNQT
jgi:hypothetical protein